MIESTNLNELAAAESPSSRQLEDRGQKSNNKSPSSSPSSSSWLRLKDPRIVRVSRAFGGKDRHSKVCTVRGLRDRRVRLSVPTAIQLYDLQDRLGLNQPSKAVDWLLNVARHDIDHLPPLPIPPGGFSFNHQIMLSQPYDNNKPPAATVHEDHPTPSNFWISKRHDEDEDHEGDNVKEEQRQQQWLNNSVVPFGTAGGNYHLEPQSFGFPTMATTSGNSLHDQNLENFKFMELPPTLSLSSSSGTHQILVPSNQELDPRTISDHHHHHHHLQMLSSSAAQTNNVNVPPFFAAHQSQRPFQLN